MLTRSLATCDVTGESSVGTSGGCTISWGVGGLTAVGLTAVSVGGFPLPRWGGGGGAGWRSMSTLIGGSGTSATSQTLANVKVARAARWRAMARGRENQPRRDFLRSCRPINECSNIAVHLQNQV